MFLQEELDPAMVGIMVVIYVFAFAITIGLTVWVYKDAQKNGMDGTIWALVTCFCGWIGCVIYLIVRSQNQNRYRQQPMGYNQQYRGPAQGGYQQNPYGGSSPSGQPGTYGGTYAQPSGSQYPQYSQGQPVSNQGFGGSTVMPAGYKSAPDAQTMMPKKHCKMCGAETESNAKFCPVCGSSILQ